MGRLTCRPFVKVYEWSAATIHFFDMGLSGKNAGIQED